MKITDQETYAAKELRFSRACAVNRVCVGCETRIVSGEMITLPGHAVGKAVCDPCIDNANQED
jgi:hypothetical protein